MKHIRIGLLLITLQAGSCLWAQQDEEATGSFPAFKFLRAEEDYRFLRDSVTIKENWNKIKYLSLGKNSYLSTGGDIRSEFQVLRNENWQKNEHDAAFFQRFMIHGDWHFGKNFRLFGQLKNGFTIGRNGPESPLDEDVLDIHQLFIGWNLGNNTFELGRREITYGSRRLISLREGTNIRQSFDGLRWIWQKENQRLDILLYAYTPQKMGVFDNGITSDQLLWGGYWVSKIQKSKDANIDLYYLGIYREETAFEEGNREETRHSFGLRHWGSLGHLQYNNELVLQTGSFGNGNITAWTISADINYHISGKDQPSLGLKAEIISGDNDPTDGHLRTFNPLYPRGGYFGLLALIGPANLMDIHPSLAWSLGNKLSLNMDWDFFWRHHLNDGIYFPSGRLHLSGRAATRRYIGHQPGLQLSYAVNRFLEMEASYFYFVAGGFVKEVSDGVNFSQLGASIYWKF